MTTNFTKNINTFCSETITNVRLLCEIFPPNLKELIKGRTIDIASLPVLNLCQDRGIVGDFI